MSLFGTILATPFLCSLVALSSALLNAVLPLNDCLCLRSFRPVCGTDQQTYDNICFLHCAKRLDTELRLAYDGICCPRAELCTDYEDTVCDQFGFWYDNDCIFEFHKCIRRRLIGGETLRVAGRGGRMCGGNRRVTATNATTTSSTTASSPFSLSTSTTRMNSSNSSFSCDFPCESAVAPVCDSQSQTHQNRCKFDVALCRLHSRGIVSALRIVMNGPCQRGDVQQKAKVAKGQTQSDQKGTKDEERNEKDHHNLDDQQQQQQQSDQSPFVPKLSFLEESQKQQKVEKMANCDFCREEAPSAGQIVSICDNANLTHQSLCSFARWNCERRARGAEEHILAHLGECNLVSPLFLLKDEKCPTKCSRHYKSVCDSNGLSHPNLCAYQMHSCLQRKNERPFGWLLSLGECQQNNGTKIVPLPTVKEGIRDSADNKPSQTAVDEGGEHKWHSSGQNNNAIECPAEPICEGTAKQQEEEGEEGPICDSNGQMHRNICMFAHAHCLEAKKGKLLRIVPIEQCEELLSKLPGPKMPGKDGGETKDKTGNSGQCERKWTLCNSNKTWHHSLSVDVQYCGTDFVTYRTLCELQLAKCLSSNSLEVLFKGPCELCLAKACRPSNHSSISADADESHFVCDQNGETLSSCEFEMLRCVIKTNLGHNVTFAHKGKCCPSEAQCPAPKKPHNSLNDVCDSNGRRHQNRCLFEVAKCRAEKVERQPKGLEERYCPSEELVKGGRGGGGEALDEEDEEKKEENGKDGRREERGKGGEKGGRKEEKEERKEEGRNRGGGGEEEEQGKEKQGENRTSKWEADESADQLSGLFVRSEMNISADLLSVDHLICNDKYDPVCASDRRTYRNACHLERRNATGTLTATRHRWSTVTDPAGEVDGWAPLRVLYPGECCPVVECPSEYSPVCDSEGRTHLNLCEFGYHRCLADRMRTRNVTITFYGLCPDSHCPRGPCPALFEPVCATNGKTYLSLCELDKTICVLKNGGGGRGTAIARNGVEMTESVAGGGGGSLELDYIGECCESSVNCSDLAGAAIHFQPLCDSRSTTHSDECAFRRAKCQAKRRREPFVLRIIRRGKCGRRRR